MPVAIKQKLNAQLEQAHLFSPFLGLNVTLIDQKIGQWHASVGYQDPLTKQPLAENSVFYIYSITKTFTSVIILKLVEEGFIDLDRPANNYSGKLKTVASITIRQLLNHTSGLPNYTELEDYASDVEVYPDKPWPEQRIVELLQPESLDFVSGQGWHYSNTGYFLLKKIIENMTGLTYARAVKELISEPLGLENTFIPESYADPRVTAGFSRQLHNNNQMENIRDKYHPDWCFTSLVASTTNDTAKFYHALFNDDFLSQKSVNQMTIPVPIEKGGPRFADPSYGLGLMIDPEFKLGPLYAHAGDGPGYNPWVMHLPDWHGRSLTLALFANTGLGLIPMNLANDLLCVLEG